MRSSSSWSLTTGAATTPSVALACLAQRGDVDLALARAVELAEEDALVRPEGQATLIERNQHLRAHQRCSDVRRRVLPVGVHMLPAPAVLDDLLERGLEVLDQLGVDALVDRHPGSRVRHVDESGRRAVRGVQDVGHELGDLDELRAALGGDTDLAHGAYPTERCQARRRRRPSWTRTGRKPTASWPS